MPSIIPVAIREALSKYCHCDNRIELSSGPFNVLRETNCVQSNVTASSLPIATLPLDISHPPKHPNTQNHPPYLPILQHGREEIRESAVARGRYGSAIVLASLVNSLIAPRTRAYRQWHEANKLAGCADGQSKELLYVCSTCCSLSPYLPFQYALDNGPLRPYDVAFHIL